MPNRARDPNTLRKGDIIRTKGGDRAKVEAIARQGHDTTISFRMLNGRYAGGWYQETVKAGWRCVVD